MYGVVGDSLNPVVDAIRRHDGIDRVQMRHEAAGAFAAGAEAQLTGRLVAGPGSCGPDNLHLINGLPDAHRAWPRCWPGRPDPEHRDRDRLLPGDPRPTGPT
jgi:pyruvate dehydrogenase (quinone)